MFYLKFIEVHFWRLVLICYCFPQFIEEFALKNSLLFSGLKTGIANLFISTAHYISFNIKCFLPSEHFYTILLRYYKNYVKFDNAIVETSIFQCRSS